MSDTKVNQYKVSWGYIYRKIDELRKKTKGKKVYGIPRGGQVIAGLIGNAVDSPEEADWLVDDIVDSEKTARAWCEKYKKPFTWLINKPEDGLKNTWVILPWENTEQDIQDTVIRQLEYIGEDASREGLRDTPKRMIKSWDKLYGGYSLKPHDILKTRFKQRYDEMVILKHIELYSTCEHHMLPFVGDCSIAYIPDGKVVGISKLARLMECFARRLQIQERLTNQIVDAIEQYLHPKGSACVINAQHFCMTSRGVEKQHSIMTTSALRGVFQKDMNARQEFLRLIERGR